MQNSLFLLGCFCHASLKRAQDEKTTVTDFFLLHERIREISHINCSGFRPTIAPLKNMLQDFPFLLCCPCALKIVDVLCFLWYGKCFIYLSAHFRQAFHLLPGKI